MLQRTVKDPSNDEAILGFALNPSQAAIGAKSLDNSQTYFACAGYKKHKYARVLAPHRAQKKRRNRFSAAAFRDGAEGGTRTLTAFATTTSR